MAFASNSEMALAEICSAVDLSVVAAFRAEQGAVDGKSFLPLANKQNIQPWKKYWLLAVQVRSALS